MALNVFQTLAEQEINKYNQAPQRRLADLQTQQAQLQLKKLQDEQAYQDRFKTAMAPQPEQPLSLANLGNPTAVNVPNSLMQPKPTTIVDQFKQQYDFHIANGRTDLAQGVMEHQIDLSSKAAKVAEHAYKTGGKEGLAAWLQANPTFAPLLGDPAHMKLEKEGVLFPASDDKGQPVPNMYWYRGQDGSVQWKEIKPEKPEAPGKPFDRQYDEGDARVTELYDAQGKLTATKRAPRYKPAAPGGQEPVAQTTFVDAETGKPLVFDKKTGSYRVANVEGGVAPKPVAMSPEQATRAQQFETIVTNIPKIRDMVLDKNGNIISKLDIANSQVGTWGTKGREIRQAVKRTVEQALRIATGAAAPDSEVKNYTDMYAPQVGDTKEMIAEKFKALETFAEGTRAKFNVGRSPQAINQGKGASGKGGKQLDQNTAQKYLRQAGGNKEKARELARKAGYTF